jgi:hydroxyacylglutathione hydrolase
VFAAGDVQQGPTGRVDDEMVTGFERGRQLRIDGRHPVAGVDDRLPRGERRETVGCVGHARPAYARSMAEPNDDRLYFRQLLSGRDFATGDQLAQQMVNFVYAIGDRTTGTCVLVDPAYDPTELVDAVERDGMTVTGVLATHYHADHVGGSIMGYTIDGLAGLLDRVDCPVHVQRDEVPWVTRTTGVTDEQLIAHDSGDVVTVGGVDIELIHTPGHTPGSQCFLVAGKLVAGDTLFLDGCGRTDLPGSDHALMIESLKRLGRVDDDVVLYPGHRYSLASSASMGSVKQSNFVFDQIRGD